jgi:hypothetical protein
MNNDLMQKLMVSKAIMDKHNGIERGQARNMNLSNVQLEEFSSVPANYNIPQEYLAENTQQTKPVSNGSTDRSRIMSSKLPDEIKKLMIENPIVQPSMQTPGISNELAEAAAKLMKKNAAGNIIGESKKSVQSTQPNYNINELKEVMREVFTELLSESGLLVESTSKSNDTISFRVGQHIFEGKVTKVKKLK